MRQEGVGVRSAPSGIRGVVRDRSRRMLGMAAGMFAANAAFAALNFGAGIAFESAWFVVVGCYYLAFAAMRLLASFHGFRELAGKTKSLLFMRVIGFLMVALALVLSFVVLLTITRGGNAALNQIFVIAQAAYTFTMIVVVARSYAISGRSGYAFERAVCGINAANMLVSLLSLQTIMLDTFGGSADLRFVATALLGAAVCAVCIALAVSLIRWRPRVNVARTRFVEP